MTSPLLCRLNNETARFSAITANGRMDMDAVSTKLRKGPFDILIAFCERIAPSWESSPYGSFRKFTSSRIRLCTSGDKVGQDSINVTIPESTQTDSFRFIILRTASAFSVSVSGRVAIINRALAKSPSLG